MLPVVDKKDKLLGYLQKGDVQAALPSQATVLDRYELRAVLAKLTIEELIQ